MLAALAFLLGSIVGSFLNVCILRIPERLSIVHPRSRCPKCQEPIAAYDNVPVLSWLLLGGKCRNCKTPISALYPAVEFLTGLLFLACFLAFGLTVETAKWAVFSALMIVLTITDLRVRLLPDRVNLTGAILGVAFSVAVPVGDGTAQWLAARMFEFPPPGAVLSLMDALIGAIAGGGFLWLVAEGYFRIRGHEGMGRGDPKMMAMVGTFLGLKAVWLAILGGALLGSLIGGGFILLRRKGSEYEVPFGTFLGTSALLTVFFGVRLMAWYTQRLL